MNPFTALHSEAAPLADADIDTDIILPARFLTLTQKTGLARYAFHDQGFDAAGRERPDFVLHQAPWRGAQILVAGANFGCGSSREQAPWACAASSHPASATSSRPGTCAMASCHDEIDLLMQQEGPRIAAFHAAQRLRMPCLQAARDPGAVKLATGLGAEPATPRCSTA